MSRMQVNILYQKMFMRRLNMMRKMAKKVIQNSVPSKHQPHFGDVPSSLSQGEDIFKDTTLLKEPGFYCFLLLCKKPRAEPFMEWVVETVLSREARKLASAIEEKDNQMQTLELRNEEYQHKIFRLNEDINDLIAHRYVARRGYFDTVLCFIKKYSGKVHPYSI